jgi:hypothetical protein
MPRGGKRPGAGRPRKTAAKPELATFTLSASGNYEPLANRPGIVILDKVVKKATETITLSASISKYEPYSKGLGFSDKFMKAYEEDELIRACINLIAQFTMAAGFETKVEPENSPKAAELKAFVDQINARVNLDNVIRIAIINAQIFGKAAFEIVWNKNDEPEMLIPLDSTQIAPNISEDWQLQGFNYKGEELAYTPEQILYFPYNCLSGDLEGLSAIEPIYDAFETRKMILTEALKEATIVLWAGIGIHRLDTSGTDWTKEQIEQIIRQHISQIKPGKHIATTARWDIQIVDLKPNLENLIATLEYLDQAIIANFQVPRFLLGREKEVNRATAYAELEAFIKGPIQETQRWIKRELEAQWYNRLTEKFFKEKNEVKIRHIWRAIQTSDFIELLRSVAQAYDKGQGFLPKEKAFELLNLTEK